MMLKKLENKLGKWKKKVNETLKEALEFVQNKHLLTEITDEQMRFLMALDQLQSEEDKEDLFEEYKQEKEYLNE